MKKSQMFFYTAAVIGFYISLILLYIQISSVFGTTLLCMSVLMLVLGVLAQWRSAQKRDSWYHAEASVEASQAPASC